MVDPTVEIKEDYAHITRYVPKTSILAKHELESKKAKLEAELVEINLILAEFPK